MAAVGREVEKREGRMEGNRVVVVSALQFACTDDVPTNLNTAERLVRDAHRKGANIILIQELFEGYYFCQAQREDFFQRAKPYKGHPTILRMQKLAKELGVVIPVSFFEEANNAHYNSIAIVDADGTDLGIYRKSHIPDGPGYQEKFYFNPGDTGFKVFETKFAKIGVAICWDQWFPEAARAMVLQGAEILLYPTAIGSEPQDTGLDSRDHWKRVMQGHAGANLVPLVASNRIGKEIIQTEHGNSEITFYGNSFIAGPTGEIVAAADDKEEAVVVAQFDLDKIKSKRYSWGIFRDRRPDLYKFPLEGRKAGISFGFVMADFSFMFAIFVIVFFIIIIIFIVIICVFYILFFIFFQDFFIWLNKVQLQTPIFSACMKELLIGDPNLLKNKPAIMSVGFKANPRLPALPYTRYGWRECSSLCPGSPEFCVCILPW